LRHKLAEKERIGQWRTADASDQEIAEAAADYLVLNNGPYHGGKWHWQKLPVDRSE
jgi:hypothetical protein